MQNRLKGIVEDRRMRFEQRNQFALDGKETLQREEGKHGLEQIRNDELFLMP